MEEHGLSVDLVHRISHILIYHFLISDLLLFWSLICWFSDLWFADSWFDLFDLVGVLWKQSPSGFEMYPEGTSLAFRLMNYLYFVWHTTYVIITIVWQHHPPQHHFFTSLGPPSSPSSSCHHPPSSHNSRFQKTIITIIKLFIVSKLKNT